MDLQAVATDGAQLFRAEDAPLSLAPLRSNGADQEVELSFL